MGNTEPFAGTALQKAVLSRLKPGNPFALEVYEEIGSTNDRAKALAACGAPAWTAVLARRQRGGRGRLERSFYSPAGGVYLSLLLRPDCGAADAGLFTAAAAVAACRAVSALCGKECRIKWPNDLLFEGKKVGGILTEAGLGQNGRFSFMVVGVGLNLRLPSGGFPPELSDAGALLQPGAAGPSFAKAAAALLEALYALLSVAPDRRFLSEYCERSALTGKSLLVLQGDLKRTAAALGIDENAGLCVEYPDGTRETLRSGEIGIRESRC